MAEVERKVREGVRECVREYKTAAASVPKEKAPSSAGAAPGGAAAAKTYELCGGKPAVCGGCNASTGWKCLGTPTADALVCSRSAAGRLLVAGGDKAGYRCTLSHVRFGTRGTACGDGNIAASAPGFKEWRAAAYPGEKR